MEITIKIPTSWNEVTIKQYSEVIATQKKEMDELDKIINIVSSLSGNDIKDLYKLTISQVKELGLKLGWIESFPENSPNIATFKILDREFTPFIDISKISFGQYIDLKEAVKNPDQNIHMILAVMTSEKGKEYEENAVLERADFFYENFRIVEALPFAVFFCKLLNSWTEIIRAYTMEGAEKYIRSLNTGAGM